MLADRVTGLTDNDGRLLVKVAEAEEVAALDRGSGVMEMLGCCWPVLLALLLTLLLADGVDEL